MLKLINVFVLLCLSSSFASALTDEQSISWKSNLSESLVTTPTKKVGNATFSVFIWDIYQSELSTSSGEYPDSEGLTVYRIKYLKNIKSKELIKKTIEQWELLGFAAERYTPYVEQLRDMWPNIKEGDQLAFVIKGKTSAFYYNDRLIGQIDNQDFAVIFMAIWFSENTSQPELRDTLLGIKS